MDEGGGRVVFLHPLVRSAVVARATDGDRRAAHRALARTADAPRCRAWHLSEAAVGPDEGVAGLLMSAARDRRRHGDAVGAVAAMLRAADLSPHGADRGRRLAEAASVGADVTGDLRRVPRLLGDARRADPDCGGTLAAAIAAAHLVLNGEGDVDAAHRLLVAAIADHGLAEPTGSPGVDSDTADALHALVTVCSFGGRDELWAPLRAAVAGLGPRAPTVLGLSAAIFADPARATPAALASLDDTVSRLHLEADPARIVRIGRSAFFVDRMGACREAHWRVVRDGRHGGAVASAIGALVNLCLDDVATGRWDEASRLAREGLALCDAHGYRILRWPLRFGEAVLAAGRGDGETARALADRMTRWAAPRRAESVGRCAHHVRALAAAGAGDAEEAYRYASLISPPGTLAAHVPLALWSATDLVDAAVRTGRDAPARAHVAALRGVAHLSPRLALVAAGCAALVEPTSARFDAALAVPGAERWPFDLARFRLGYGEYLRRTHATALARPQLASALDAFARLGAVPWATRARAELRAAGGAPPGEGGDPDALTPQEREIALLAATGLTNKEIGQRLHLSHRTVGAHLYRAFPKLGIGSRAALRDALECHPHG